MKTNVNELKKKFLSMTNLRLFLKERFFNSFCPMRKKNALFLLLIVLNLSGCRRNPLQIDVSDITADIRIMRFEETLFSVDPTAIDSYIPQWKEEYGRFFTDLCYILNLGNPDDPGFSNGLRKFVTDRSIYQLYTRTMKVYPGLDTLTDELDDAFRHYLYYFPDKPVPRIYTYISGLSRSAITDEDVLAIGLDSYLGRDEILYKQAAVYNYLTVNMHPAKIISDCMLFWGETEFPYHDSVDNLISKMIYQGRLVYFAHAMLPDQPDSLLFGFQEKNLEFCATDEESMWTHLIENKLLFSTDKFTIDAYILEGPFTKDFGRDSPARAAVWLGYRIVNAYMTKNPDITVPELMQENDYMKILNLSGYNP
jgi:hypothetical protein